MEIVLLAFKDRLDRVLEGSIGDSCVAVRLLVVGVTRDPLPTTVVTDDEVPKFDVVLEEEEVLEEEKVLEEERVPEGDKMPEEDRARANSEKDALLFVRLVLGFMPL